MRRQSVREISPQQFHTAAFLRSHIRKGGCWPRINNSEAFQRLELFFGPTRSRLYLYTKLEHALAGKNCQDERWLQATSVRAESPCPPV